MSRLLTILLALVFTAFAAGCAGSADKDNTEDEVTSINGSEITTEVDNQLKEDLRAVITEVYEADPIRGTGDLENLMTDREAREKISELVNQPGGIDAFIALLVDDDSEIRKQTKHALGILGHEQEILDALIAELGNTDRDISERAAWTFYMMQSDEKVPESLVWAREKDDPVMRMNIAYALARMRDIDRILLPEVIETLNNEDPNLRYLAARAIVQIGEDAHDAFPRLIEMLGEDDPDTRVVVIQALRSIGDAEAVPSIIATLGDENLDVRLEAARALGRMDAGAEEAVPVLIEEIGNEDVSVRSSVLISLGMFGPDAFDALPVLIEALEDEDSECRLYAISAIGKIGPAASETVPLLLEMMENCSMDERVKIAWSLFLIGEELDLAFQTILAYMEDDENYDLLPAYGSLALADLGIEHPDYIPEIIKLLEHENEVFRAVACMALGRIGPAASDALPILKEMRLDTDNFSVIVYAMEAIRKIESK